MHTGKIIRAILIELLLLAAGAALLAGVAFVLSFVLCFRVGMAQVQSGKDWLLALAGLVVTLALPAVHYRARHKLTGALSVLSALEAFLFVVPVVVTVILFGRVPAPFFPPTQLAPLAPMVAQGVIMLLMLAVPVMYALFYLYLVVEKLVSSASRRR